MISKEINEVLNDHEPNSDDCGDISCACDEWYSLENEESFSEHLYNALQEVM